MTALLRPGTRWRNWSRIETAKPKHVVQARDVADVVSAVQLGARMGLTVKAAGAGHSFTGIAVADGILVDISALSGVIVVDGTRVRLGAGTHLHQLPALLDPLGLALANMGDIDRQTIAGATSTGTHGTGAEFGGLATQIVALTLVTGDGSVLTVSETENAELLPAARLGLGALGILVDITIQCVPSFLLRAVERPEPLDDVLDDWMSRATAVDHFEFYWFPHTRDALTKSNTRLPADAERRPQAGLAAWVDDELVSNGVFALTCGLTTAMPGLTGPINRLAQRVVAERELTDRSYAVFTAPRRVRFREMEYALPVADVPEVLRQIDALIESKGWQISFPVEVRIAAADENWMSTAYGRQSGYIAVHQYWRQDPTEYFAGVEAILRSFDGRPHWGKRHTRSAEDLRPTYAHFDDFVAVRDRLDPERRFANAYLGQVLGE